VTRLPHHPAARRRHAFGAWRRRGHLHIDLGLRHGWNGERADRHRGHGTCGKDQFFHVLLLM